MRNRLTVLAFAALTIATGISGAALVSTPGSAAIAAPGIAVDQIETLK